MDLVNGNQGLGTHVISSDLSGLNAGIYLCRLEAGEQSAVVKVSIR
jgi:hypothetical protein